MKPKLPLGDTRFAIIRIVETAGGKLFIEPIKANKELRHKDLVEAEAERLANLGDGVFVVEVITGFSTVKSVARVDVVGRK